MTSLRWIGPGVSVLAFAAVVLTAIGSKRWTERMATLTRELEAGRNLGSVKPLHPNEITPHNLHELEGLCTPVQRYFRAVLKNGQPIVSAVTIDMAGTIDMSAPAEQWKSFTSIQSVVNASAGSRPGFIWDAKIAMLPGIEVHVDASYIAGKGLLRAAMLGLFTVADMGGGGAISKARCRTDKSGD